MKLYSMEKTVMKLTRKIQLVIDLPDKEERNEALGKLYGWQNRCYRAANLIVSHLYVQEMINEFLYLSEGIHYKLVDEKKDDAGILQRSRINTTYRVVSDRFKGEMPTNILTCLNGALQSNFKKNKLAYWKGERSLMNFRKDMPFPFSADCISRIWVDEQRNEFCFRLFQIPFRTYLGKDFFDKRKLLEGVMRGEIKLCTSQIKLEKGKIFWLPILEIKKEENILKPEVVAEASLSLEYPIVVKTDTAKLTIGSKEEFLYRRLALQEAKRRAQSGMAYTRSGKGKKRKLKGMEKFRNAETNYINHRLHVYSRKLIDFCVKQQAGTLILVNQENRMEIAKEDEFILRNWSYYELMTKIKYKAEKSGIELVVE